MTTNFLVLVGFFQEIVQKAAIQRIKKRTEQITKKWKEHKTKLKETGSKIVQKGENFKKNHKQKTSAI